MKSNKTTIIGVLLAVVYAIQPILDGTGYHLDGNSVGKILMASLIAGLGYIAKDHDAE